MARDSYSIEAVLFDPNGQRRTLKLKGRDAWTLVQLAKAGEAGCTPISRPAPRWSEYVRRLRDYGVLIDTENVGHSGMFAGKHGIYKLRQRVRISGGTLKEVEGVESIEGGGPKPKAKRAAA